MHTSILFAALPFFRLHGFEIGPFTIQPWGMLVASGFMAATVMCQKIAVKRGMDPQHYGDVVVWMAVGALVFGHLGHALFYYPKYYFSHPIEFLYIWDGLSSIGGFLGCTALAIYFFKKRKVPVVRFGDVLMFGLTLGWAIGRLGCFVVHDHIGRPVASAPAWVQAVLGPIAMTFPDNEAGRGVVEALRFELGLVDSLLAASIFVILMVLARKPRTPGFFLGLTPLLYGSVRFWTDFLRATELSRTDTRYLGLTPAQYASLLFVVAGIAVMARGRKQEPWPAPGTQPWQPPEEAAEG